MTIRSSSDPESVKNEHSFRVLLNIRPFRYLWIAQLLSQTAHNGIHYVELLMIARLTDSTGHVGLMILAFTLPAVLFSAIAGLVVDRWPKRHVLVGSNMVRVITALSYILALEFFKGDFLLFWVYSVTFLASAIAQFFAPAEGATIPMLVPRRRLITANALFNLTITGTQVLGLLVLFPFVIKFGDHWLNGMGIEFSFALVAIMYAVAAWLLNKLPPDPVREQAESSSTANALMRSWEELREGWAFVRHTLTLWVPLINLSITATIAMILAMMAPKFASDILHASQEDAIYIFAPAGLGMLTGTFLMPHLGARFRREHLSNSGLLLQGTVLFLLGLVAQMSQASTSLTIATMMLAFGLGLGFALIGIPAQTMLQEGTPHQIRGRVFSVQFLLANLLSIPPMLFAGALADTLGLAFVTFMMAIGLFALSTWSILWAAQHPAHTLALDDK